MDDQEVMRGARGDAAQGAPRADESPTGDPKGSRTPGVGAANGRRPPINIETPPLSSGTHLSDHVHVWVPSTSGKHRRMLQPIHCACGLSEFGYPTRVGPACVMQARDKPPLSIGTPIFLLGPFFPFYIFAACLLSTWEDPR